ncbi:hypothetical protein [Nannocystis punicea]|uniref:Uncharacterized protein n=1 Tax=Nannocystis punicea TaxID=2995304 RepID=A0ABY7H2E7_9BACT|nr:hypothetical protein [Nannocystis poenicansa]WAS93434.1 hypothetical protein O0S08_45395 [Nannocystis poenicansa]
MDDVAQKLVVELGEFAPIGGPHRQHLLGHATWLGAASTEAHIHETFLDGFENAMNAAVSRDIYSLQAAGSSHWAAAASSQVK